MEDVVVEGASCSSRDSKELLLLGWGDNQDPLLGHQHH